jgi:hypothetical protein
MTTQPIGKVLAAYSRGRKSTPSPPSGHKDFWHYCNGILPLASVDRAARVVIKIDGYALRVARSLLGPHNRWAKRKLFGRNRQRFCNI